MIFFRKKQAPQQVVSSQTEGCYVQNRRAISVGSTLYPLPIEASPLILTWKDGANIKGEISNGIFYPHVKL